MSVATTAPTGLSRQRLLEIARSLPPHLSVLSTLGKLLQDVNTGLDDIAVLLKRDVALAARIVRISNSPVCGGGGQIGSVEEAVNRVGFAEILRLVGAATTTRLTEEGLDHYGVDAEEAGEAMLYTAVACEALAGAAGEEARTAYTLGLLRPLGMLVLERAARGRAWGQPFFDGARWRGYSEWEGETFGIDNCEVAGLILDEWRFPAALGLAVREHYLLRPDEAPGRLAPLRPADRENRLACLLHLAGVLAMSAGHVFPGERTYWSATPEKLAAAGLDEAHMHAAAENAAVQFARLSQALA
jgi:HD-like signal output (HDOD) protein